MTRLKQAWLLVKVRRVLNRHGLVAIATDEVDRLCADASLLLVAEIEAELVRVSAATEAG
ncbi:hypothetical protein BH09ACT7_BH09ACT7_08360 [soil metagenome]